MPSPITLPLNTRCGYFDCSVFGDRPLSPRRTRTLFEIEFYLENGQHTFSDGNTYLIRRHHVLIGRPGEICNSELPFHSKFLKLEAEGALAEELTALPSYFPALRAFEIEEGFDRLLAIEAKTSRTDTLEFGAALLSLLVLLIEDGRRSVQMLDPSMQLIERAKDHIRRHCGEALRLSDVAAAINLSPSYFHSLFTEVSGITPHEHLMRCRIARAKEMLCATSTPLEEISQLCGFGSQQYMANVFRKRLGLSPGKCRRAYRESYLQ